MEFYKFFISFLAILKRSLKLFLKNWKSLASITILSQFLISILILLFSCILITSGKSFINDAFLEPYNTNALKIGLIYLVLFLVIEFAFIFAIVIISKFASIATILISVVSCGEKTLSLQDLISRIVNTWKRLPVVGWGISPVKRKQYWIFVGVFGIIQWQLNPNLITLLIAIFVGVITLVFYMYLAVDLVLARVVTVVEENSKGQKALEKSEQLIEGHKMQGFLLNILFNLLVLICFLGYWLILRDKWIKNPTLFGLFLANIGSLANMFESVAYTVLYSECKKRCGEEIEFRGIMEYTKLSSIDIP